jgi:hypothetical protein
MIPQKDFLNQEKFEFYPVVVYQYRVENTKLTEHSVKTD